MSRIPVDHPDTIVTTQNESEGSVRAIVFSDAQLRARAISRWEGEGGALAPTEEAIMARRAS